MSINAAEYSSSHGILSCGIHPASASYPLLIPSALLYFALAERSVWAAPFSFFHAACQGIWPRHFQNLRGFPVKNMCIVFPPGKTSLAERKMLSSESIGLSKKAGALYASKRREYYEQQ